MSVAPQIDPLSIEIVIPVRDMAAHLRDCLPALLDQLGPSDRISVVDDGSSDGGRLVAEQAGVRTLSTGGGRGPYEARHLAALESRADALLFVDARCRARPGLVEAHRALLSQDEVVLSCTDVVVEIGDSLASRIAGVHDWFNVAGKISVPGQLDFYPTANLGVLREVYAKAGGFRRMRSGGDADLCWRIQLDGLGRFGVDPRSLMSWVPRRTLRGLFEQSYRYGRSWAYLQTVYPTRPTGSLAAPAPVTTAPVRTAPRPSAGALARTGAKLSYLALRLGYHRENASRASRPAPSLFAQSPSEIQSPSETESPVAARSAMRNLSADIARYRRDDWLRGRPWWITERNFSAVLALRLGQRIQEIDSRVLRTLLALPYSLGLACVQAWSGVEIWPDTEIGPGLRIHHGGNIVINAGTRVGSGCLLRQGVTLGLVRDGARGCPVVGDDVEFGAYAQVLGPVVIGDGAKIGAMSVVLHDVPAGATAVGVPARIILPAKADS